MEIKMRIKQSKEERERQLREFYTTLDNRAQSAVNMTAYQIKDALVDEMRRRFHRPVPYTLNALYVRAGKGKKAGAAIRAEVRPRFEGGKSRSEQYLLPEVYGGGRRVKSFEYALRYAGILPADMYVTPGERAPLDAYGNISAGFIVQMLSYLRAFTEMGYRANITSEKRDKMARGTKKKRGTQYFVIKNPGTGLHPGIYRQTAFGLGCRGGTVWSTEPMMAFVKQPLYHPLIRWDEVAARVARNNYRLNFDRAKKGELTQFTGISVTEGTA